MKSGKVYDPQKLLGQVKGEVGPSGQAEVNSWFEYDELMKKVEALKAIELK
jgi:hypothetical protein